MASMASKPLRSSHHIQSELSIHIGDPHPRRQPSSVLIKKIANYGEYAAVNHTLGAPHPVERDTSIVGRAPLHRRHYRHLARPPYRRLTIDLYRLYIGIVDGMSIAMCADPNELLFLDRLDESVPMSRSGGGRTGVCYRIQSKEMSMSDVSRSDIDAIGISHVLSTDASHGRTKLAPFFFLLFGRMVRANGRGARTEGTGPNTLRRRRVTNHTRIIAFLLHRLGPSAFAVGTLRDIKKSRFGGGPAEGPRKALEGTPSPVVRKAPRKKIKRGTSRIVRGGGAATASIVVDDDAVFYFGERKVAPREGEAIECDFFEAELHPPWITDQLLLVGTWREKKI